MDRSARPSSASAFRRRLAVLRSSGFRLRTSAPTKRTMRGGRGGPSSTARNSASVRTPRDTRRDATTQRATRSMRPAAPGRSSSGKSADVRASWATSRKRRTAGGTATGGKGSLGFRGRLVLDYVPEGVRERAEQLPPGHAEEVPDVLFRQRELSANDLPVARGPALEDRVDLTLEVLHQRMPLCGHVHSRLALSVADHKACCRTAWW